MNPPPPFEFGIEHKLGEHEHLVDIPPGISTAELLLQIFYNHLELPGYFGFNWNALSDCLRDLHWVNHHVVIIRHADIPPIPREDLRTYVEILAQAVLSWKPGDEHTLRVTFPADAKNYLARL